MKLSFPLHNKFKWIFEQKLGLFALFCLTFGLICQANETSVIRAQADRQQEIPPVISSYPEPILALMTLLNQWSPSTQASKECETALALSRQEMTTPISIEVSEPCRSQLDLGLLDQVRSKIFFNYDLSDRKKFIRFTEKLNAEVSIRGLAGIHHGQRRPLAILRMGVHGNRDEVLAERYIFKLLFEDLKMHVIMLENLTSHSYLSMNEKVTFGGVEEGLHSFLILKRIQNQTFLNSKNSLVDTEAELSGPLNWSQLVTTYHNVGLSLGGQGTFFTTWLDEQTTPTLQSTLLFCPLVNMEDNFKNLSTPSAFHTFVDVWNWRRLIALRSRVNEFNSWELVPTVLTLKPRFTPVVTDWINQISPKPLLALSDIEAEFPDLKFDFALKAHLEKSKGLFELNQFWPLYKNEKIPITIVTTKIDPLVSFEINSGRIKNGTQPGSFKKINLIELEGFHCSLVSEYQWPFLVELSRRSLGLKPE